MLKLEGPAARSSSKRCEAKVKQLLMNNGAVCGVLYEKRGEGMRKPCQCKAIPKEEAGKDFKEEGPVILATGGFGADFTEEPNGLLFLVADGC